MNKRCKEKVCANNFIKIGGFTCKSKEYTCPCSGLSNLMNIRDDLIKTNDQFSEGVNISYYNSETSIDYVDLSEAIRQIQLSSSSYYLFLSIYYLMPQPTALLRTKLKMHFFYVSKSVWVIIVLIILNWNLIRTIVINKIDNIDFSLYLDSCMIDSDYRESKISSFKQYLNVTNTIESNNLFINQTAESMINKMNTIKDCNNYYKCHISYMNSFRSNFDYNNYLKTSGYYDGNLIFMIVPKIVNDIFVMSSELYSPYFTMRLVYNYMPKKQVKYDKFSKIMIMSKISLLLTYYYDSIVIWSLLFPGLVVLMSYFVKDKIGPYLMTKRQLSSIKS